MPNLRPMTIPILRPMTNADIEPASAAILADDWGDRRAWFAYVSGSAPARAFVAEAHDGSIVGTSVAAIHGPVGWIGTIWVRPDQRGQGLGRALTIAAIDAAEAASCRTLVLVATDAGRPVYERLGFTVQTWYRTMERAGRDGQPPPEVRPFRAADLGPMLALDRLATGEDRGHALAAFAGAAATQVLADPALEAPRGFVVRAPWGGGATVSATVGDAMTLLDARRVAAGPTKVVRCGIVLENEAGAAALEAAGWTEAWRAPRLVRGEPLDWHPEMLWGQFNHAMG